MYRIKWMQSLQIMLRGHPHIRWRPPQVGRVWPKVSLLCHHREGGSDKKCHLTLNKKKNLFFYVFIMVLLHFIVRLYIFKAYWLTRSKVNYIHMTNISHIERWRAIFNNYMGMSSVTCHHREGGVWPKCHHGVIIGREGKKKAKFCVTWYVDGPLSPNASQRKNVYLIMLFFFYFLSIKIDSWDSLVHNLTWRSKLLNLQYTPNTNIKEN